MKVYERDYTILTEEERKEWEAIKQKEIVCDILPIRKNLFRQYPKPARHYLSLFPNNYLDIEDLKNETQLNRIAEDFLVLLAESTTQERTILNYIKNMSAHFIIASILKSNYNFGHHASFIFPEFMLGNSYKVDYLIVGKSSGGYEFVFVELQNPYGKIIIIY